MANNEAEKVLNKQIPTANCQCALNSQRKLELSVNLGVQFSFSLPVISHTLEPLIVEELLPKTSFCFSSCRMMISICVGKRYMEK